MDTKHIHCMLEKISEYGKCMMEEAVGAGNVNLEMAGKIVDMVKDLAEAEHHALIAKKLRKEHEEDEEEEKIFLKMLKDQYKDEYKEMKEQYGDEADKRFYDNYRYKRSGRFAPKGKGSYMPRRGYDEPPYYHMTPEDYREHSPEWYRDMDRHTKGVMYFSSPMGGNMSGGNSSVGNGNSGGNTRSYTVGFDEGTRRGYEEGYRDGRRNGGGNESRSERARRSYTETKEMNKDSSPESKQHRMKELDSYMNELNEDMKELIKDMTPEEKTMLKQKMAKLSTLV